MKKFILVFLIFSFLSGCGSVSEGFRLKKGNTGDEFLVEKKNPLSMPPDFNELPEPTDDESNKSENQNNLKEILKIKTNNTKKENTNKNTSLENKILEKINN